MYIYTYIHYIYRCIHRTYIIYNYIYIYRTHTHNIYIIIYTCTQNIYHNICNCRSSPLVAFNLHQGLPRPVSPKGNPKSCKRMSSPNCLAKLPSSRTHGRTLLFPLCAPHRLALSHQSTVAGMQAYVEDASPLQWLDNRR